MNESKSNKVKGSQMNKSENKRKLNYKKKRKDKTNLKKLKKQNPSLQN